MVGYIGTVKLSGNLEKMSAALCELKLSNLKMFHGFDRVLKGPEVVSWVTDSVQGFSIQQFFKTFQ